LVRFAILLDTLLYTSLIPLLPQLNVETGLSESVLGLLLGAYPFAGIFACVPFGLLSDRWNPRSPLIFGVGGLAVGSVLIALSPTPLAIGLGRLMHGISASAVWTAGLVTVSALAGPEHRGREVGLAYGVATVGGLLGPLLSGYMSERFGFAALYWVSAVLSIGVTAALMLVSRRVESPNASRSAPPEPERASVLQPVGLSLLLVAVLLPLLVTVIDGVLLLFMPLKLARMWGLTAFAIGVVYGIWSVFLFASQVGSGYWADRFGRRRPLIIGLLILGISLLGLGLTANFGLSLLTLMVTAIGFGIAGTVTTPILTDAWEARRPAGTGLGTAYGVVNTVWSAGFLIGNAGGGWLLTQLDMAPILSGLALLVLLSIPALFLIESNMEI
jgi:MFS family permease